MECTLASACPPFAWPCLPRYMPDGGVVISETYWREDMSRCLTGVALRVTSFTIHTQTVLPTIRTRPRNDGAYGGTRVKQARSY